MSEGRESAISLTKAVSGTAKSNPMISPQPAPEQHANGHRDGSDQKARADQLGIKKLAAIK